MLQWDSSGWAKMLTFVNYVPIISPFFISSNNTSIPQIRNDPHCGALGDSSRTVAVNALVIGEIFYLFNCRYLLASAISWKGFLDNRYVLIAIIVLVIIQLLFTYMPVYAESVWHNHH